MVKVNKGDTVIYPISQYEFAILEVLEKAPKTITTKFGYKGRLHNFKAFDFEKVYKMQLLSDQIQKLLEQYRSIYKSLDTIE